jgi:serine/threonine-protein kinase HipA
VAYEPVGVVEARIWGRTVGALQLEPSVNRYAFEFDPSFLRTGQDISPLRLPRIPGAQVFTDLRFETYRGLPAAFADSLPDSFGNALVNAALTREGVREEQISSLDRLAYLGKRGTGALEYYPMIGPRATASTALKLSELVVAARAALEGTIQADEDTGAALHQLIQVGTSAGGARAKAVVAWNPATQELRSGQADVPAGFEHWLLKFDVGEDGSLNDTRDYGRIEFAYHLMAIDAGLQMSDCRLLEEHGRAHFMTRRFDRVNGEKIHLQTLCAIDHLDFQLVSTHEYGQYLQVIDRLGLGAEARAEGFRRMAFNLYMANLDDHTKNLSFAMGREGEWSLSPAYDVTHSYNSQGEWTGRHQMGVEGKFAQIRLADLQALAERHSVPRWKDIVDQVRGTQKRWLDYATFAGVPEDHAALIAEDMRKLEPSG